MEASAKHSSNTMVYESLWCFEHKVSKRFAILLFFAFVTAQQAGLGFLLRPLDAVQDDETANVQTACKTVFVFFPYSC